MDFSCRYIHHLLLTHELLGFILLAMHNLHHYLSFFATVRQQVTDGTLESYTETLVPRLVGEEDAPE